MFLHRVLWYNYAKETNEMHTFQINALIRFLAFSTCFYIFRTFEHTLPPAKLLI